ncbi:MAG: YbbR-like domain-containing protein [Tannerella sp.]|jgi:hypothetical protein|nr:YbbR-like domain-containing protein [Tannerella sp.]
MQNKFISALKSILRNTEDFFRSQQWKEILVFLFFLLLSFGFWLLQSLQEDYEQEIELPLRYKNIPPEWILSEDNPEKISILLKDKGSALLYYSWKSHFSPVDIPVSGLPRSHDQSFHVTSQMLETAMSKQLISSTSIISIEPREIVVKYDSLGSRRVPVVPNVTVNTRPGFQQSGDIEISHPEISLYGSRKILDTLNSVRTKLITLENASETKELTADLELPAGVKAAHETVKLTVPVEEFTEKRLRLPVSCYDIPAGYTLRIYPSSVEVVCDIPMSRFRELTVDMLEIRTPFDEFGANRSTGKLPVRLTKKPPWVADVTLIPGEVEFIMEQPDHD